MSINPNARTRSVVTVKFSILTALYEHKRRILKNNSLSLTTISNIPVELSSYTAVLLVYNLLRNIF